MSRRPVESRVHATFGATNTAVKQTDWSPVAPFGEGVVYLRHKPTKSAEITEELSYLVIRHLDRAEHCTLRHSSLAHAIASSLIEKTQNTRPHRNPVGGNKHGYFAPVHQREAATSHVKTCRTDRGPGGSDRELSRQAKHWGETEGTKPQDMVQTH